MRTLLAAVLMLLYAGSADASTRVGALVEKPARYSEIREPADPAGTVLVIHGGGWQWVGPDDVRYEEEEAARFRSYGWRTVNVDYRAGYRSLRDVIAWYDWTRVNYSGPVCVFGRSAGAHLALMLASRRRVDCVIGHGAITDLRSVHGSARAAGLRRDFIAPSFGSRTARFSPVQHPALGGVPVLLASSVGDDLGGCRQLSAYRRVRRATRTYCLPAGDSPFMHADVDAAALDAEHARERTLLASVAPKPRHLMPQPPNLRVHYFLNPQCGGYPCADPTTAEIWVGHRPDTFLVAHETGHVWWYQASPEVRAWATVQLGYAPDTPWSAIFGGADPEDSPPDELAADAYAACDLGLSPTGTTVGGGARRRIVVKWPIMYGYLPSAREYRVMCARIRAAG